MRKLALLVLLLAASAVEAQTVRITQKPEGLVHGDLLVPVTTTEPVTRVELLINGVKWVDATGRSVVMKVKVGDYLRRLRIRAVGYDAQNNIAGEDEMVINDPRPPFRVHLSAPKTLPENGNVGLSATVIRPAEVALQSVELFVGEEKVATVTNPPYAATFDAAKFQHAVYARVAAHGSDGSEANDVFFFGSAPSDQIEVTLQHVPLSIAAGARPLRLDELTLIDDGKPRKIEQLTPAEAEPLHVVLLIDYSESMLDELPVVKAAAKSFAKALLRPQDRIAIVGFNQRTFWLTNWTNDWDAAAAAVDRVKPIGETHLYDSAIEMLYELQKTPGRHALVVLTDGVDQGSAFKLDHLVHYARYAGVPVYPIIKNKMLSRLMRFGVGQFEARRLGAIARDTGATYFIIQKESELPGVYAKIAEELRRQYQLVFYSDASTTDVWHPLAITTRGGQLLRIPRGYFP
ncbi:MAG TPA: VWA domain-containing protein [Thermoanaerobaculia bacterium]|nr:VWA domain-containing protein [Thermoanaerobaculia bacterium]